MAESIDEYFTTTVSTLASPQAADATVLQGVSQQIILDLFDAQLGSRHLDLAARWLRARARASTRSARRATRAMPPSRRRSGRPIRRCCTTARAVSSWRAPRRWRAATPLRDVLLGLRRRHRRADRGWPAQGVRPPRPQHHPADLDDRLAPAAGGRCRVRDRPRRANLASHSAWPDDALAVCSFGDASANHSTAVGRSTPRCTGLPGCADAAVVRLRGQRHRDQRQDAGDWIAATLTATATGWSTSPPTASDLPCVYTTAAAAADWVRTQRRPAFLHLRTVRLMGHAGSDFEAAYRRPDEITADYRRGTRCCAPRELLVERGCPQPRRRSSTATRTSAPRSPAIAQRSRRVAAARTARRGDGAAARKPRRGRR